MSFKIMIKGVHHLTPFLHGKLFIAMRFAKPPWLTLDEMALRFKKFPVQRVLQVEHALYWKFQKAHVKYFTYTQIHNWTNAYDQTHPKSIISFFPHPNPHKGHVPVYHLQYHLHGKLLNRKAISSSARTQEGFAIPKRFCESYSDAKVSRAKKVSRGARPFWLWCHKLKNEITLTWSWGFA